MKTHIITLIIACSAMALSLVGQNDLKIVDMSATISGTSTMHDWTSNVNELFFEGQVIMDAGMISAFENVTVKIPVSSIRSHRGNLMDRNTWNALKIEEFPIINFSLHESSITKKPEGNFDLHAVGDLTIVGTTKTTALEMNGTFTDPNTIVVLGSKEILMSEYNMKAPSFLFGAYSTGDLVTFDFELKFTTMNENDTTGKMN